MAFSVKFLNSHSCIHGGTFPESRVVRGLSGMLGDLFRVVGDLFRVVGDLSEKPMVGDLHHLCRGGNRYVEGWKRFPELNENSKFFLVFLTFFGYL